MCFYHGKHELADINNKKYGFIDYYKLSEEPQFADGFNEDSKFKINKEAILNNVKTVTQPDPATIESSKTKGLEMIKDVQRPKP